MAADYSTNVNVAGGTMSVGGSISGGIGNQVHTVQQTSGSTASELIVLLGMVEATARQAADLPERERAELAADAARAKLEAEQPQPNLGRVATLLRLIQSSLDMIDSAAGSATALGGMVARALRLLPPGGG